MREEAWNWKSIVSQLLKGKNQTMYELKRAIENIFVCTKDFFFLFVDHLINWNEHFFKYSKESILSKFFENILSSVNFFKCNFLSVCDTDKLNAGITTWK